VMKLVARLVERTQVRIPVRTVFQHPTPRMLAKRLEQQDSAADQLLIPLSEDLGTTVMVAVHPGGGFASVYSSLAKALAAYTWVGIDPPLNAEGDYQHRSIAELADVYIDALLADYVDRPLILLGWSFGGNIAQQMAHRLHTHGVHIEALILLDSVAQTSSETLVLQRAQVLLNMAKELGLSAPAHEATDPAWLWQLAEALAAHELAPSGLTPADLLQAVDRTMSATRMMAGHRIRPHDSPTLLVKALVDAAPEDCYAPWRGHSVRPFQQVGLEVSHGVLCGPKTVATMAATITEFLDERSKVNT